MRIGPNGLSARTASTPSSCAIAYSDWSSSPPLGVKPRRKWGSRSADGPGTPSCSVAFEGSAPTIGCRGPSATVAPKQVSSGAADFTQI